MPELGTLEGISRVSVIFRKGPRQCSESANHYAFITRAGACGGVSGSLWGKLTKDQCNRGKRVPDFI